MQYIWQSEDWTRFRWKSDLLIESVGRIRFCQGSLLSKVNALGMNLSLEAQAEILTEETIKTSEIEGLKIDRESVRSSVAKRLDLPTVGLKKPDRYTDGLVDILLDATKNHALPLTAERLKSWQAALFPTGYSGLCKIRTGDWRGSEPMQVVSGHIGRKKIHFEAPPAERIEFEISNFLSWWEESAGKIEGLLRAGIAHFYFVTVHPFEDGNGRIARAITDMAIAQDEKISTRFYTLSRQIEAERDEYYQILERSQKGDCDITEWLLWFLGCLERAVKNSEFVIAETLAKADFWRKHSQTPINDRQRKVIHRLLEAGRGKFEGGLTCKKYQSITSVISGTALREISDLVDKGILQGNQQDGRNISYDLVW